MSTSTKALQARVERLEQALRQSKRSFMVILASIGGNRVTGYLRDDGLRIDRLPQEDDAALHSRMRLGMNKAFQCFEEIRE